MGLYQSRVDPLKPKGAELTAEYPPVIFIIIFSSLLLVVVFGYDNWIIGLEAAPYLNYDKGKNAADVKSVLAVVFIYPSMMKSYPKHLS